ncbi:putative uncharacterized protein [Alistipes sp. CAG:831]|nr:putative uncharacterized protein [Alistipes sp. CAG:831]
MEDGKFLCNFTILDRKFTYRVLPEEESVIRSAVKNITDKLADLRQRHNFVDNQQALTVVLIQFAVLLEMARMEDATGRIVKEIQLLDKQLDEYLETDVI